MIRRSQTQLDLRPEPFSMTGEPYLAIHFRRGIHYRSIEDQLYD